MMLNNPNEPITATPGKVFPNRAATILVSGGATGVAAGVIGGVAAGVTVGLASGGVGLVVGGGAAIAVCFWQKKTINCLYLSLPL